MFSHSSWGEAWFFGSVSLLTYALLMLILFHLFVVFYSKIEIATALHLNIPQAVLQRADDVIQ